jgi:hypothetical protein
VVQDSTLALDAPDRQGAHPDHHLWRNGRVWWIAFTFHTPDGRKHRVRKSLATNDVVEARVKRDRLLGRYAAVQGWRLALRFVERESARRAPLEAQGRLCVA